MNKENDLRRIRGRLMTADSERICGQGIGGARTEAADTMLQNWLGRPGENHMASETPSGRSASPGTGKPVPNVRSFFQKGVFRKEGEYWTVGCGAKAYRLKDTRGLGYLAQL